MAAKVRAYKAALTIVEPSNAKIRVYGALLDVVEPAIPKIRIHDAALTATLALNVHAWDGTTVQVGKIGVYYGGDVTYPS